MKYATFWQRLAAMWIDGLILVPLYFIHELLRPFSREVAIILVVPMTTLYCAYTIYCHGRYGQTIGKHAMGIRVVRTTGERIGWRESWLRGSIDVVFSILTAVSSFIALAAIADSQYYGVGWLQRTQSLQALEPTWLAWTATANLIWTLSEVVVMFFNTRRRALHDFIGGTVVISEQRISEALTQAT